MAFNPSIPITSITESTPRFPPLLTPVSLDTDHRSLTPPATMERDLSALKRTMLKRARDLIKRRDSENSMSEGTNHSPKHQPDISGARIVEAATINASKGVLGREDELVCLTNTTYRSLAHDGEVVNVRVSFFIRVYHLLYLSLI